MAIEGEFTSIQWHPTLSVGTNGVLATRLPVADGFDVDVIGRALLHEGNPVHLRPREFQLLAILASNPGRAFTRLQLISFAWDSTTAIGPRTVDVHVHWLRAKIESEPRRPTHIVTVRGYGYRLDPPR